MDSISIGTRTGKETFYKVTTFNYWDMTTFKEQKRKQNGLMDIVSKGTSTGKETFYI